MKSSQFEIPTRPWPGPKEYDLTGQQFGSLKVIGYYGDRFRTHRGSAWVCQCACGRHEVRRSRSLKREAVPVCQICQIENKGRMAA